MNIYHNPEWLKLVTFWLEWNLSCAVMKNDFMAYNQTALLYQQFAEEIKNNF